MLDEFDDTSPPAALRSVAQALPSRRTVPHLVAHLYGVAPPSLRTHLLQRLLAPMSTLAVAAVAAGAFGRWLYRSGGEGLALPLAELDRLAGEPMIELASFVEQVSPQALEDVARLFAEQPLGLATFSVGCAWLLLRLLRQRKEQARPLR